MRDLPKRPVKIGGAQTGFSGKFTMGHKRAAKLSPEQVLEIRRLYSEEKWTQGGLARAYGMSVGQIGRIVRGEQWAEYQNFHDEGSLEEAAILNSVEKEEVEASEERIKQWLAEQGTAAPPPRQANENSLEKIMERRGGKNPLRRNSQLIGEKDERQEKVYEEASGSHSGAGTGPELIEGDRDGERDPPTQPPGDRSGEQPGQAGEDHQQTD